jgi:hypothetical protein
MPTDKKFEARLAALRQHEHVDAITRDDVYRNGQIPLLSDDVSQWDNFDRYFKFYNISPE